MSVRAVAEAEAARVETTRRGGWSAVGVEAAERMWMRMGKAEAAMARVATSPQAADPGRRGVAAWHQEAREGGSPAWEVTAEAMAERVGEVGEGSRRRWG